MDKPIFDENKKRSREEDGNETSGANDSANSVSDLSEQDKYLEPTAHQGSIDRSMNYMMPPFVPDQKAYEAGLEHARNLARASRARKKEAVENSRSRSKEILIEREKYMLLLKLHDIPISPDSMAGTFSLSSLDASELFTSLQSMNEQEQQLMSNKQRISDTRLGVTAESDLTEEHLEILRKDRNRIHAKKARLKRKIIAQELQAIERKLEDELLALKQYAAMQFPGGLPALPTISTFPPSLAEALEKIESLAKYGDILVSSGVDVVGAGIGPAPHPIVPGPQMPFGAPYHPQQSSQAVMFPQGYYAMNPLAYPCFYPPPRPAGMDPEPIWTGQQSMTIPMMLPPGPSAFPQVMYNRDGDPMRQYLNLQMPGISHPLASMLPAQRNYMQPSPMSSQSFSHRGCSIYNNK